MDDMQDLQWLASEIDGITDINELNRIIQTAQGIPALLANDRKTKLMQYQQRAQGAQALAQGQKPPVMAQIKGQAAQQEAARQAEMMQLAQLAALQQPEDMGLAALPYDEEEGESPEYQSTEDEGAEEGQGAAVGGLVALAEGGAVIHEKDYDDKFIDTAMAPLQLWKDIYGFAHGGDVRGFSGEEESFAELDPTRDSMARLSGPAADAMQQTFARQLDPIDLDEEAKKDKYTTKLDAEHTYFRPWPSESEGAPKKHIPTAEDYYKQIAEPVSNIWGDIQRGASTFLPTIRRANEPSTIQRPNVPVHTLGEYYNKAIDTFSDEATPKSENQRAVETQHTSNQTTASGATTELPSEFQVGKTAENLKAKQPDTLKFTNTDTGGLRALGAPPKAAPAATTTKISTTAPPSGAPATPPAGGQTVAAPGGQGQGQQQLPPRDLETHEHQDEIVRTIDNPKLSWQDKVQYLKEVLGAPYQMSPELLSKYEKQLADMRSEKGWMTGLSFLSGMLGARTPWMSQALSEGGIQALGTYGKYADDENKLQQSLLEQQMGIEKAPVEARQKAGLEFLKQQTEGQKQASELKKTLAARGLDYKKGIDVAHVRNKGGMDKAAFDRTTKVMVQTLVNEAKKAGSPPSPDRANSAAQQLLAGDGVYAMMPEGPEKRAYFNDVARNLYNSSVAMYSGHSIGNIGGAGQPIVIPTL